MKLLIRYYALLRELSGEISEEFTTDSCYMTVKEVLETVTRRHPELSRLIYSGSVLVIHGGNLIRDLNYSLDLCSNPVIDLVPPSAGGERPYEARLVLGQPIDVEAFLRDLLAKLDLEAGAVTVYFGVVKGKVENARVEELRYEYHEEYTEKTLEKIAMEASRVEDVKYVAAYHSIGTFKPGDTVFAVGVVSRGRKGAIKALQEVIERVKHEAAIWKIEKRDDGVFWVVGDGERIPSKTRNS